MGRPARLVATPVTNLAAIRKRKASSLPVTVPASKSVIARLAAAAPSLAGVVDQHTELIDTNVEAQPLVVADASSLDVTTNTTTTVVTSNLIVQVLLSHMLYLPPIA